MWSVFHVVDCEDVFGLFRNGHGSAGVGSHARRCGCGPGQDGGHHARARRQAEINRVSYFAKQMIVFIFTDSLFIITVQSVCKVKK